QPLRCGHHILRLTETERETLVIEVRNGAPFHFEDFHALLEDLIARIQNLAFPIARIVALFHYRQYRVDCELVAAGAKSFRNIAAQTEAELLRARGAQIGRLYRSGLRIDSSRCPVPAQPAL